MPNLDSVSVTLRKFLTLDVCPEGWAEFDLYLMRDGEVAFYAGQSGCAFQRVWDHIQGGVHGHSIPGRFLLANWPKSGSFTIDLFSSRAARFAASGHNLDAAERALIEQWRPVFNVALNQQPLPLPAGYRRANAPLKQLISYKRMLREAAFAVRQEAARNTAWGEE